DEELYGVIMGFLDEAIVNLQGETTVSMGDDDFIYQGDTAKWIAFANMLKARYMIHTQGNTSEILQAIDNGFQSNDDDAKVNFFEQDINPWADIARDNADLLLGGWISEQFVQA